MNGYCKLRFVYQALGSMAAVDAELDRYELEGLHEIVSEIVVMNKPTEKEVKPNELKNREGCNC
jgi:hypothetical protein